ncbi:hypothetical protein [Kibdelosporangium aridum]|uniref:hypothetical protein n=1 Tax=Kibdelosporangium aridum TaxID=2030 RepID=UPI0035ED82A8
MAGLSLSLGTTGAANASPTPPKPVAADAMSATAKPATVDAACPQPGQRVKQSAYPEVYVVDPDFTLRLIPDATTYFNLWESWGGVVVYDDLVSCYREYVPLFNAHLVKLTTDDPVYIWDHYVGYRHITDAAVFNKYGFSWDKIRNQSVVGPIAIDRPWDY